VSLPLVELPDGVAVVVSSAAWAGLSFGIGYLAHRLPVAAVDHDTWLTRLRPWERDGRVYERRLRIRTWKRRLPEGGDFYDGGFSKRHLRGRRRDHLERFMAETRRAELVHWALLGCSPLFLLWNRPPVAVGMVVFGVAANAPFIVVQRYNRARLVRLLSRPRLQVPT
jgi:glycosyl-4,4'-diaponeurosporenoate acyltransferase